MKASNFRKHHASLRSIREDKKKRKVNWDRIIYLVLLSIGGLIGFKYLVYDSFFVKAEGQVLFKKLDIQFTKDIQIKDIYVEEGDSINIGDTLFSFEYEINNSNDADHSVTILGIHNKVEADYDGKRARIEKEIGILKIERAGLRREWKGYKDYHALTEKEVFLDVQTADKLIPIEANIRKTRTRISTIDEELRYLKESMAKLEGLKDQEISFKTVSAISGSGRASMQYYICPIAGTITRVLKEAYEVALESEKVMYIHSRENVFIKAFFDQKNLKNIHEKDVVHLKFPDGRKCNGVIERFYHATYVLPKEFQNKYEPTQRGIAADIVPQDSSDVLMWEKYYKMSVAVSKSKM